MGHGPMQYMRQFKAFACDYEYYLTLSDKPQSVCLTERQMYILSVWNSYTPWMTRWYNTEDVAAPQLALIAAEIEDLLMCGCGVPAPSNTDYFSTINYINNTQTTYNDVYNTWNDNGQSVVSIAPNLDFDTGDPVNISKLICAAVELLVKSIMAQARGISVQTQQQNESLTSQIGTALGGLSTAGGIAIGIGGLGAAVVAFFGGPWMLLGLALGAVGLSVYNAIAQADTALFDNTLAIDHVICSIQQNLDDKQVTRATFAGALVPLGYAPGTPEAQIAGILQPFFNDLNVYLQFMSLGNQLYGQVSSFAEMPDCGCAPGPWCRHYDYAHDLNTIFTPTGSAGDQALWQDNMWKANTALIPARITLKADLGADYSLTEVQVIYNGTNAVGDANAVYWFYEFFAGVIDTDPFTQNVRLFGTPLPMARFDLDTISSLSATAVPITVGITDIYIRGIGPEPESGEPC